jgi:CelD/BcsL family acetyltransferase involved in cellulose biosynthesis
VTATPRLACRVLDRYDALATLRASWQALCDRFPRCTPFQRPEWLLPWVRHFGPAEPWIVVVHAVEDAGERLVGLVPLFRYERERGGTWQRVLALLGAGLSDHLDLLIEPGWERAVLDTVLHELARRRAEWDTCELDEQSLASPVLAGALPPGWSVEPASQSACPMLALPARVEELGAHVPASHVRRFEQYRRRARREGTLRFQRADARSRELLLDGLFRLHARRWQEQGLLGVLAQPGMREFHGEVTAEFCARGALGLYGLWLEDRQIACLYGLFEARTLCFYLSGFDPDAAHLSPGTLIVGMVIEDAITHGMTRFDFLRGSEPYKYWWGASDGDHAQVRVCLRWSEHPAPEPRAPGPRAPGPLLVTHAQDSLRYRST